MIHQCYFEASQRSRLFAAPLYRGFGLSTAVNPDIARNCPELADPTTQQLLSEYGAMLHLWRNPELDGDPWIGFTSYRQLDKSPTVLCDRQSLEAALAHCDIAGWGFYTFVDAASGQPVSLAEQGERCHPGITSALWRLLLLRNEPLPANYVSGNTGLFCNYWVMAKANFDEYLRWSFPLVRWYLKHPDAYSASHPRSLGYLVERLFICWYGLRQKRLLDLGQNRVLPWGNPQYAPDALAESPGAEESFTALSAWNMTLRELCRHHRVSPRGILHVGAHHGQEREGYRLLGADRVLWIEADPQHLAALQANVGSYAGHRALQACLSDVDDQWAIFYRTNNRGESSSLLPLGEHSRLFPDIHVVDRTALKTVTFRTLVEREQLCVDDYDFLVLDAQGAELLVLKGFGDLLKRFHGVYVEVNLAHLYQGCALLPEIDAFLRGHGLSRRETLMTRQSYGDALYLRDGVCAEPPADLTKRADQARNGLVVQRVFTFQAGEDRRVLELLDGGKIGDGQGPDERAWLVRACGHDIVLEMVGVRGRSCCLMPEPDGIWRGVSVIAGQMPIELTPATLG